MVAIGERVASWGTTEYLHAATANANLELANLTNATLNATNLTKADLFGVNLSGATVSEVLWNNTTCPDGTNSDNNGGTCLGHGGGL